MTWTAADSAEQDALTCELVYSYFAHRDTCDHCLAWRSRLAGSLPCPYVASAISIVLEWRTKRQLLSTAQHLRIDQSATNAAG